MALTALQAAKLKEIIERLQKPNLGSSVTNTYSRVLHDALLAELNAEGKEVVSRLYLNTWIIAELETLLP